MKSNDVVTRFFKICTGISLILFSAGFLFFSLKYNAAIAEPNSPKVLNSNGVIPVGIEATRDNVIIYGYNANAFAGSKIIVLAKESPLGR